MSILDKIYTYSPKWTQDAQVSLYGYYWRWLRLGGKFSEYATGYKAREFYSLDGWIAYQASRLRQILEIACEEVPYYRRRWNKAQKVDACRGEIRSLPILTKDEIRANAGEFLQVKTGVVPLWTFHTSGTTGTPIATKWTLNEIRDSIAIRETRSANWAGVTFRHSRATISGRMVVPDPDSKGPYHRFNLAENQVYFSAFHIRPDTAAAYVNAMKKHKVEWLTGYAVSYYLLAKMILEQDLEIPPIKAVITTSEKLTPEMRRVMQAGFHCPVFEEYSTVESALFASECERGRLHVSPDAGLVEILRQDGTPCLPEEAGEVVTTSFLRTRQPFIRFRLGDYAAWDSRTCPCGREMPVIKEVIGRVEDVVTGPDGRQLVRFHGIFVDQPHILEGQIVQESLTDFTVRIVPLDGFSEIDVANIRSRMMQRLGKDARIEVEPVKAILRDRSGKFKAVISKVKFQ